MVMGTCIVFSNIFILGEPSITYPHMGSLERSVENPRAENGC